MLSNKSTNEEGKAQKDSSPNPHGISRRYCLITETPYLRKFKQRRIHLLKWRQERLPGTVLIPEVLLITREYNAHLAVGQFLPLY